MSVYTELSHDDVAAILAEYTLGRLRACEGIAAGIENSNFFVTTDNGRYVLTIFERMNAIELPFFMRLMQHLAAKGVPCPDVMPRRDGSSLFEFEVKQGCIVSCLPGETLHILDNAQLRSSGHAMAALHLAGAGFDMHRHNPTGMAWLKETVAAVRQKIRERYGVEAEDLLLNELQFQQLRIWRDLPSGIIHGDLFADNILFEDDTVSGIIDFYYAHDAPYVMDVAIALNAQAVLLREGDEGRIKVFLDGYQQARKLKQIENNALPELLRLAALRFWVSRLYDALFPRGGAITQMKDPEEYRMKLLLHRHAHS